MKKNSFNILCLCFDGNVKIEWYREFCGINGICGGYVMVFRLYKLMFLRIDYKK